MSDEIKVILKKMDERMNRQEAMMQQLLDLVAKNNQKQTDMDSKIDRIKAAVNYKKSIYCTY